MSRDGAGIRVKKDKRYYVIYVQKPTRFPLPVRCSMKLMLVTHRMCNGPVTVALYTGRGGEKGDFKMIVKEMF